MSAASDYQQAVRLLTKPLPAYVTYTQRGHVRMDAIEKDINETVTVRTSDGKTVKGKELEIYTGAGSKTSGNILKNSPFETSCYTGLSSRPSRSKTSANAIRTTATSRRCTSIRRVTIPSRSSAEAAKTRCS
jgi:hypothetical protein